MGLCLIAYSDCDWICLHIFRHLQANIPMRYIHFDVPHKESYSLDSVGKHGFAMEIGPQPHGVVRSNVYAAMKAGVQHMLDWVCFFNSGTGLPKLFSQATKRSNGGLLVRPTANLQHIVFFNPRQDQDFCLLHPEDPLFQTFSGETLRYKGDEALYPFFINECAYYEKGIALSLARKRRVMVPAIRVQTERERQAHMEEEEEE
uniref:AstE/AspA barrel-sandwich hybrid domain-containing protein n=1 Tax=Gasterosteus aculeatus aculeatus TaxID=481459 RepID=A0AAQ4NWR2_GASAC